SSFLIPTAVVLLVFSTPILRRRPTFVLNVCAIALGLAQGMFYMYFIIKELIAMPTGPIVISVITALCIVIPTCSLPVRIGSYGPLVAMKVARVANAFYLIGTVQRNTRGTPSTIVSQSAAVWSSPFAKSELFLQLVYSVYVSGLFLPKIRGGVKNEHHRMLSKGLNPTPSNLSCASTDTGTSLGSSTSRLRTLFWIALSNFVFPVIFDIATLVLVFRDHNYMDGSHVTTVNSYVSILGVLFSTIWASGLSRLGETTATHSNACPHTTSYGTPLALGRIHIPLFQNPTRPDLYRPPSVPPALKVRSSSRTNADTLSVDIKSVGPKVARLAVVPLHPKSCEYFLRWPFGSCVNQPVFLIHP
ncbi:hypothetical protein V8D89_016288, partial [Ganoderma adspersum]